MILSLLFYKTVSKPSNSHIKFTAEIESNNCLPFLDVIVRESDGSITTLIYRYLNFFSHHPLANKISLIKTLYCQVSALSSSLVYRTEEEVDIRTALQQNGYPTI